MVSDINPCTVQTECRAAPCALQAVVEGSPPHVGQVTTLPTSPAEMCILKRSPTSVLNDPDAEHYRLQTVKQALPPSPHGGTVPRLPHRLVASHRGRQGRCARSKTQVLAPPAHCQRRVTPAPC